MFCNVIYRHTFYFCVLILIVPAKALQFYITCTCSYHLKHKPLYHLNLCLNCCCEMYHRCNKGCCCCCKKLITSIYKKSILSYLPTYLDDHKQDSLDQTGRQKTTQLVHDYDLSQTLCTETFFANGLSVTYQTIAAFSWQR